MSTLSGESSIGSSLVALKDGSPGKPKERLSKPSSSRRKGSSSRRQQHHAICEHDFTDERIAKVATALEQLFQSSKRAVVQDCSGKPECTGDLISLSRMKTMYKSSYFSEVRSLFDISTALARRSHGWFLIAVQMLEDVCVKGVEVVIETPIVDSWINSRRIVWLAQGASEVRLTKNQIVYVRGEENTAVLWDLIELLPENAVPGNADSLHGTYRVEEFCEFHGQAIAIHDEEQSQRWFQLKEFLGEDTNFGLVPAPIHPEWVGINHSIAEADGQIYFRNKAFRVQIEKKLQKSKKLLRADERISLYTLSEIIQEGIRDILIVCNSTQLIEFDPHSGLYLSDANRSPNGFKLRPVKLQDVIGITIVIDKGLMWSRLGKEIELEKVGVNKYQAKKGRQKHNVLLVKHGICI